MNICLSYWSALECWRGIRRLGIDYLQRFLWTPPTKSLAPFRPSLKKSEAEDVFERYCLTEPLEIAIGDKSYKRGSDWLRCLTTGNKLQGRIIEIEPGLYLPDPLSCFQSLSTVLAPVELIWLGYEMCSSFVLEQCIKGKPADSLPLFDVDTARAEVETAPALGSKRKALLALKYVKPFAASPPEIEMSMKLGLPFTYGGEALDCHELNPELKLSEESQEITGTKFCRGDVYFRDIFLDLEYQSFEWHMGVEKQIEDDRRRNMLVAEGNSVVFVYGRQLRCPDEMNKLARSIYSRLGKRYRPRYEGIETAREELYRLFSTSLLDIRSR